VPSALSQVVEAKFVGHFRGGHGVGEILFIRKHQQNGIPELVFVQHPHELFPGLTNPIPIVAIDDKNKALSVLEVVSPERSNFVLSADVPHCETDVLVFHGFHVETNSRDCGHDFAQFQLVENCGFTGGIQTDHQNSHFLLAEKAPKN